MSEPLTAEDRTRLICQRLAECEMTIPFTCQCGEVSQCPLGRPGCSPRCTRAELQAALAQETQPAPETVAESAEVERELRAEPELIPCPFCGKSEVRIEIQAAHYTASVVCQHCGAASRSFFSKKGAAAAWNRRPQKVFTENPAVHGSSIRFTDPKYKNFRQPNGTMTV